MQSTKNNILTDIVLVGTYKRGQLNWIKKHNLYNYPVLSEDDNKKINEWDKVKELWLYTGSKAQRYVFSAKFLGIKSREDFLHDHPDYPKGEGHGNTYVLFSVNMLYNTGLDSAIVHLRIADFAKRTPKLVKALKKYETCGEPSVLLKYLPNDVASLPKQQLYVSESAMQLMLFDRTRDLPSYTIKDIIDTSKNEFSSSINNYKYITGDALDFLHELPDKHVQLVITSPPYNTGKEYEARTKITHYLDSIKPIINELARVVSDHGSICWQTGNYVEDGEVFPLDIYYYQIFKTLGFKLRNRIIWHFGHGLHCKNRFSGRYETILWFTKSDQYDFYLDPVRIPSKYPGKRYYKGDKKGQLSGNPLGKNPEDVWTLEKVADDWDSLVWEIPNVKSNHPEKVNHPCQFPLELVERCILALTKEGDIVYDPFAGVGTTIVAALKNGRVGYGTEIEKKYVEIGLSRIKDLHNGILKYRPITQDIFDAQKAGRLSQIPAEWLSTKE